VHDAHAAAGDSTHGKLTMARHPELTHQEDIKRRIERRRDFVADRDAATRKRENELVAVLSVLVELRREHVAGLVPIPKHPFHCCLPSASKTTKASGARPRAGPLLCRLARWRALEPGGSGTSRAPARRPAPECQA